VKSLFFALILAQAGGAATPSDTWAEFPKVEKPAEKWLPGPYVLIVSLRGGITKINYKSGPACGRARDAIEGKQQAPAPGQIPLPSARIAYCVPLDP